MQVNPALPWTSETQGGTIQLAEAVTLQDIGNNKLAFVLNNGNHDMLARIEVRGTQFILNDEGDERVYECSISADGKQITVDRLSGADSGFYLKSVAVVPSNGSFALDGYPIAWNKDDTQVVTSPIVTNEQIVNGALDITIDDGTTPEFDWEDNTHEAVVLSLGGDQIWRLQMNSGVLWLIAKMSSLPSGPSITAISVNANALSGDDSGDNPNDGGGGNP